MSSWSCNECTYLNKATSNLCELCLAPKPSPTAWACIACTFNNPGSAGSCQLCLTPRLPSFPNTTTTTRPRAPSEPSEDLWTCNSCGWFHNAPTAKSCEVCGTGKRVAAPTSRTHSKSVQEYNKWACPSCTLTNSINVEKCELCRVPKPNGAALASAQALAREADELTTALAVLVASEKKVQAEIALQAPLTTTAPSKTTPKPNETEEDDEEEDDEEEDDGSDWEVDDAIANSLREVVLAEQKQKQNPTPTTTETTTAQTTTPTQQQAQITALPTQEPSSPSGGGHSEREKLAAAAEERLKQSSSPSKPTTVSSETPATSTATVNVPAARQSLLRRMDKRGKLAGAYDQRITTPKAGDSSPSTVSQPRKSVKKPRASQRIKLAQAADKRLGTTEPSAPTTDTTTTTPEQPLVVASSSSHSTEEKGKDGDQLMKTDPDQESGIKAEKKSENKEKDPTENGDKKEKISVEVPKNPVPRKSLRRPAGDALKRQSVMFQLNEWKQANQLIEQGTGKKDEVKEIKEDTKSDTKADSKDEGEAKIKEDLLALLEGDTTRMQALEKHSSSYRAGRVQANVFYYFIVKTFGASLLPQALPLILTSLTSSPNRKEALRCMHTYAMANKCPRCMQSVYHQEGIRAADRSWHRWCFKCCFDPSSPLSPTTPRSTGPLSPTTPRSGSTGPLSPTTPRGTPLSPRSNTPAIPASVPTTTFCTATLTVNNYISARGLIYCQKHAPK